VVVILIHAVSKAMNSSVANRLSDWVVAIDQYIRAHRGLINVKLLNIHVQVMGIVGEIKHQNILKKININRWEFSQGDASIFAAKFMQCASDNILES